MYWTPAKMLLLADVDKYKFQLFIHLTSFVVAISIKFYCFISPFLPSLEAKSMVPELTTRGSDHCWWSLLHVVFLYFVLFLLKIFNAHLWLIYPYPSGLLEEWLTTVVVDNIKTYLLEKQITELLILIWKIIFMLSKEMVGNNHAILDKMSVSNIILFYFLIEK